MGDIPQVILMSLLSALVLLILTELMGQKQLSQLNMFDYVTGITIGSIAAEMATELDKSPVVGIVSMAVYALLGVLFSWLGRKSLKLRRKLNGRIYTLMEGGKLNREVFKKVHLDLSDFLMLARVQGYYDPAQIETALMEPNGTLSFLPKEKDRPATVGDLGLNKKQSRMAFNLIMDGKVMEESLKNAGVSLRRLKDECKRNGYADIDKVFLAAYNDGEIAFY